MKNKLADRRHDFTRKHVHATL